MQGSLPSLIFILIVLFASNASAKDDRKNYIVMLDDKICINQSTRDSTIDRVMKQVLEGSTVDESVFYRYPISCEFAASLTSKEAKKLAGIHEIVDVTPDQIYHNIIDDGHYYIQH